MSKSKLPFYSLTTAELFKRFTTTEDGLTTKKVEKFTTKYGPNQIVVQDKTPLWKKLIDPFMDPLVLLLVGAALISFFVGEWETGVIFMVIVALNAGLDFWQNYQAENIMSSLKGFIKKTANVRRNGKIKEILSTELVPGDIVLLDEGESVPADIRLFKARKLAVNSFALTGESVPQQKSDHPIFGDFAVADRTNMLHMGSSIVMGSGEGVVVATGMKTVFGNITDLSSETNEDKTPLQKQLAAMAKKNFAIAMVVMVAMLFLSYFVLDKTWLATVIFSIVVATSMVPQGLPLEINLSLLLGVFRLGKRNAVIKKLDAVEALGSASVICTDKTGTLTRNEMDIEYVWGEGVDVRVQGKGYLPTGKFFWNRNKGKGIGNKDKGSLGLQDKSLKLVGSSSPFIKGGREGDLGEKNPSLILPLEKGENNDEISRTDLEPYHEFFYAAYFNNHARLCEPDDTHPDYYVIGDPTEGAIRVLGARLGLHVKAFESTHEDIDEVPFDSDRKMMSTVWAHKVEQKGMKSEELRVKNVSELREKRRVKSESLGLAGNTSPFIKGGREGDSNSPSFFKGGIKGGLNPSLILPLKKGENNEAKVFTKGAAESVLAVCDTYKDWQTGEIKPLTIEKRREILEKVESYAIDAYRVLAVASKSIAVQDRYEDHEVESELTYFGCVAMMDLPRKGVAEAFQVSAGAQIKTIMITGDNELTAVAIAKKIGIIIEEKGKGNKEKGAADYFRATGAELAKLSDKKLIKKIEQSYSCIFSRVSPQQKLRIVKLLKSVGEIVAVTGDGVNDAPALKQAHIGVSMGRIGTEVAKEASQIVLADDSYSTLVHAIKEGRTIYQNLVKTVKSCYTSNFAELFVVLFGIFFAAKFSGFEPLAPVQILLIDLLGETAPLIALTFDPLYRGAMKEPPRNTKNNMLNKVTITDIIFTGLVMGGASYGAFALAFNLTNDPVMSSTAAYLMIIFTQYINILSRRHHGFIFSPYLFSNKYLWWAMGGTLLIVFGLIYSPLGSLEAISFKPLAWNLWPWMLAIVFAVLVIIEAKKQVFNRLTDRKFEQKSAIIN